MRDALDWLFRNRETAAITIGQTPNPPLWIFLAASVGAWLAPAGSGLATGMTLTARGALTWWAADEILRGVNPWRRLLGAGVLGFCAWAWLG